MELRNQGAEIFLPGHLPVEKALARTTHMGIGAHQDDIEIMAYDGILKCFGNPRQWFLSVTVTNGSGSPRSDFYATYTDKEMMEVRREEQKKAAVLGGYTAAVLLDYPSSAVKNPNNSGPQEDLRQLVRAAKPKVVYTHIPADRHDTHVAVMLRTVAAIKDLPGDEKPERLYGCEVWRDLDWMIDDDKVALDVSAHENLAWSLLGVFDSQICGGKRYDLATMGRRRANATYSASRGVDTSTSLAYAMDLTPLIHEREPDVAGYVGGYIDRFKQEIAERLKKLL
jgi:LmbE family N-acetylglucosaminyl deacetylase